MKIAAVICHNGLGHYKRTISVLSEIKHRIPECNITVLCEQWQVERMSNWAVSSAFWDPKRTAVFNVLSPGVQWSDIPEIYGNDQLLEWKERLADVNAIHEADVVVSDNLSGVLEFRDDAIMMGSFLWSDVLERAYSRHEAVRAFAADERRLLDKCRPPMLCVADMAMKTVFEHTEAIGLPWFCTKRKSKEGTGVRNIAVLGGATGYMAEKLFNLAKLLAQDQSVNLFVHGDWLDTSAGANIRQFTFDENAFDTIDLVICRPGIGTITDCVSGQIPIIAIFEANNAEMAHNAKRIEELGIGWNIASIERTPEMARQAVAFSKSENFQKAVTNLKGLKCGGIEAAAMQIIKYANK